MKAIDISVLDVRKLCDFTDFLVICTGDNRRHLRALEGRVAEEVKRLWTRPKIEGESESGWLLVDAGDVVVHLFDNDARQFYDLELLWGDAPRVKWRTAARTTKKVAE